MNWDGSFILLPGGLGLLFGLIGLAGTWRRIIGYLVCAYAALVIVSQHNAAFADIAATLFNLSEWSLNEQSGLVFGITLAVIFIGLRILFEIVWRPTSPDQGGSAAEKSGWVRLFQAVLNGLVGWVLGAVLLISILAAAGMDRDNLILESEVRAQHDAVYTTGDIVARLTKPWLPGTVPLVLQQEEEPSAERIPSEEPALTPEITPSPVPDQESVTSPGSVPTLTAAPRTTLESTPNPSPVPRQATKPELVEPFQGRSYKNPITFKWNGSLSPGQAYQVTAWLFDKSHTIHSDPLATASWETDLPLERSGDWRWQVSVVSYGQVVATSSEGMFWFAPFQP